VGLILTFRTYIELIRKDLFRYGSNSGFRAFMRSYCFAPGYKYTFWMRTAAFLGSRRPWTFIPYIVSRIAQNHYTFRYGIEIPPETQVGAGFYIGHFGGIVVNYQARIGKNCNLNCGAIIGATYGGRHPGVPTILDRVYIGPGAKIIGGITIGNDVAIGPNSVVVDTIPDGSVVVGIPGRIISQKGSGEYVCNTVD